MSSRVLPEFEMLIPKGMDEALTMLRDYGERSAVMAGGTDLLVMMGSGFKADFVLSLSRIPDLDYIIDDPGEGLRIGAMATLSQVCESQVIKKKYRALWEAAVQNGSPQTRNMGTVVGNLLRASPSGDCCCAILALGGTVILKGREGTRAVPIDEFWLDYGVTARKTDEIAVEVKLPPVEKGMVSAFKALTRTTLDLAKINAAACFQLSGKKFTKARLAIGAVAPTTIRLKKTETVIEGKEIDDTVLAEIEKAISSEISPIDDVRSTAEYRQKVSGPLVKRVIQAACNGLD